MTTVNSNGDSEVDKEHEVTQVCNYHEIFKKRGYLYGHA